MIKKLVPISLSILQGLIIALLITHYIAVKVLVCGVSMYPTLEDGQTVMASIISYHLGEPERFDIAIINGPWGKSIVKRIIGLPGERIRIDENGGIYINDVYLDEVVSVELMKDPGQAGEEICLGKGEYFVLGDNRNNSLDSRSIQIGIISREWIKAKVILFSK